MNEFRELGLSHLGGLKTKDKEQRINGIGLAAAVGPDDGAEGRVKWSNVDYAGVGFEVDEHDLVNGQSGFVRLWLFLCEGNCRGMSNALLGR